MPSVVDASEEFEVSASRERCWEFFANLSHIGSCIPGCESVTLVDENTAQFRVKLKVGYISKTFELKAKLAQGEPMSRLSFVGEGNDAEIHGALEIHPLDNGETSRIKYKLEIRALSVSGKTAIAMIGNDLVRKQASEFATCVKSKLEN